MYNFLKVKYGLTVIFLTSLYGQIESSEFIPDDIKDATNGKFIVIKNESYFGGNVNKTKFIVTSDSFDQQPEDFSQFEDAYPHDFGSFEQLQEHEAFPISSSNLKNGSTITRTYTFYSNQSNSIHQVPDQIQHEHAAKVELIKAEQNVDTLNFITQYYYRSIFIGNLEYFSDHWAAISTGNPTGYGAIGVKLSFAFPFYDRYITDIIISSKGFIETGLHVQYKDMTTQYIAPLMANFDVLTTQDSIVYYDDGEKFTVFWENVHFETAEDNLFFFGVTLYKNGDIVFSYKDIPMSIKSIYEKDNNFKIGISDTYVKEDISDEYRQLLFNNYDITSNTMLWMTILPTTTKDMTEENNPITEVYKTVNETVNDSKPNGEVIPIINSSSQVNFNENLDIEYQQTTEEQDIATTETSITLPDVEVQMISGEDSIKDKSDESIKTESSIIKSEPDKHIERHSVDESLKENKYQYYPTEPQLDTHALKYENHSFYKSVFIGDTLYFNNHWDTITKSKPLRHSTRNQDRLEKIMRLSFDFPFYNRIIRSVKVANEGFIDLNNKTSGIENIFYYIAPLMTNFEIKTQSENIIKNYEDNEKFTTVWDGVFLKNEKQFTFAVTLYRNGDIVFAYKDIPIPIKQVYDTYKQTKIGISDGNADARQILFNYYDIKSNTILKIVMANNSTYIDKVKSLSTPSTEISLAATLKSETSRKIFGGNRNKYTKLTENVTELVSESPSKMSDGILKHVETISKLPNSRRKIIGIKEKTSDNTSESPVLINQEETHKTIRHQETASPNELANNTNIHLILTDRSDSKADIEEIQHPVNHNFYQSLLTNNAISFEDHWMDITNQKPLKLPGRTNSRRNDFIQDLTFDFPFYGRIIRSITITNDGFINVGDGIHGLQSKQYIAPLMVNFDKKSIRQNSIKLYDDGGKFTVIWENVRLQVDKSKIFTFAVTIYKNGEIIFAYKNMPITLKMIFEIDPQLKVGISDIITKDDSMENSDKNISFLSDEITEDSILKLTRKRSCKESNCDKYGEVSSEQNEQQNTDSTTNSPLLDTMNHENSSDVGDIRPRVKSTTEMNNIKTTPRSAQREDASATESIKIVDIETNFMNNNTQKVTEAIDEASKGTRPLVKITGLTGKITGVLNLNSSIKITSSQVVADKSRSQENQSFNFTEQNNSMITASSDHIKTNNNSNIIENSHLVLEDRDINNLNYKYDNFYKSVFITSTEYFNEHWAGITKTKPLRQPARGNTRRSDTTVKLNFDFPFYGRTLRSITVANEGFIVTNDRVGQDLPNMQYIAPLMVNFTNKANSQTSIKLYNDIDKFTALWENLFLQEDKNYKFTFAVTLFKNGDIIFAYRNIPISVQELLGRGYKIKIGVNNITTDEDITRNYISFMSYKIISDSLIKIINLRSCEIDNNCNSFENSEVNQIAPTTQNPFLEDITQANKTHETTTATVLQTTTIESELTTSDIKSKNTLRRRRPIGVNLNNLALKTTATNKAVTENILIENQSENSTTDIGIPNNNADNVVNNSMLSENSPETIRGDQDINNLNYVYHQFYTSSFINNREYFNKHWEGIIRSKQIKQAGRGNTRRSDINAKVAFGFPFYNHTIRNIKVSIDGFIDTGLKTDEKSNANWYISPFMTNFDSKINSNAIKLYQDGEKFTALWENLYFIEDKNKAFTFAVTLYKNGDIIFAYKNIPIKIYSSSENEHSIKIGIYYLQTDADDSDKRILLFKNYDISTETLLRLTIKPICQDDNICDKLHPETAGVAKVSVTQAPSAEHSVGSMNNSISRGRYVVDGSGKNVDNSSAILQQKVETLPLSEAVVSTKSKSNGGRRKAGSTRTKIESNTFESNISVDEVNQLPAASNNESWPKVPNIDSDKSIETYKLVKATKATDNVKYIDHGLYKSSFIANIPYFEEHWKYITSSKPLRQAGRSNSRRSDTVVKLTFDFPYFDHIIRNIIVTNEGLINIGDTLQHGLMYSQYIAPLRAPFDNKSSSKSKIKLFDDGEKFTTLWENVYLHEDLNRSFTFAVTLYRNGNIIFAYKDIPAIVNEILGGEHQVLIGINDDNGNVAQEYRHISFTSYDISNNTILKLISLQTCKLDDSCDSSQEVSTTTIKPVIEPIEMTTIVNLTPKRLSLLQTKSLTPATKPEEEEFSPTTKAAEESSETPKSSSAISTTAPTSIRKRLIGNRRRAGQISLSGKLINNEVSSEHQVAIEHITKTSIDIEKSSEQNLSVYLDSTMPSTEAFESSTGINEIRKKIGQKNFGETVTHLKLHETSVKNKNGLLMEVSSTLQPSDATNSERDSEINSEFEITGQSNVKDFIEPDLNISSLHYIAHEYYKTAFISDPLYFNEHWKTIIKGKPIRQPGRSNTRRTNIPIKLSFDFPYYGHSIRNITVTNQGSLIIGNGDDVTNVFTSIQYIAPLMLDFDSKVAPQNSIKIYEDEYKFTAVWEKMRLEEDKTKAFTFAVTLYKNGDILFSYKDIPFSIQEIGEKYKLKIGLSGIKPDDNKSFMISFLSYRILSGSIIKLSTDSSDVAPPQMTLMSETNKPNENLPLNTNVQLDVSKTESNAMSLAENISMDVVPSPLTTKKDSGLFSSKIKLINSKRKSLSTLPKISNNQPKLVSSPNTEDTPSTKTVTNADSLIIQNFDDTKDQNSEKDLLNNEENKSSLLVTTAIPPLTNRPVKMFGNNLRTANSLKYKKTIVKNETTTPTTFKEEREEIFLQNSKEGNITHKYTLESDSLSKIEDDTEREPEQEIETQTLAYTKDVTKSEVSGFKEKNKKLHVASDSISGISSSIRKTGSVKFSSKVKSGRPDIFGITQTLNTVSESQSQIRNVSDSDSYFSQESTTIKSDGLEELSIDKRISSKIGNLKFKINTSRPKPVGKIQQNVQKELLDKEPMPVSSKESTELRLKDNSSSENLTEVKLPGNSNSSEALKAQTDINDLSYKYYESYRSTFFRDSEYFTKYWEEITNVDSLTKSTEKSFETVSLSFDFPFYGRTLRNVTVTGKGFIDITDKYDGIQSTHYIAPLKGDFEPPELLKIYNDPDKFTVLWENVYFLQEKNKTFTFAVTLYNNGDIVFAYKNINLSLDKIYGLDSEANVGIADGDETNQISFRYYDITSDSILKLIKTETNESNADLPEMLTTVLPLSFKPSRITLKPIGKKTLANAVKVTTKTIQEIKTDNPPKNAQISTLIVDNTSKISGLRKISTGRRYQVVSSSSKTVGTTESQTKFTQSSEIAKSETLLGGNKDFLESSEGVSEKTLKIPGRRIVATKSFQSDSSTPKVVVFNENKSEIVSQEGDLGNSKVISNPVDNTESAEEKEKKTSSLAQNIFTRRVNTRKKIVDKNQVVNSINESFAYNNDTEGKTELFPESELHRSEKLTSDITLKILEPEVNTGEQSSGASVANRFKTTSQRRLAGKRFQLPGTASKFTLPSVKAIQPIPKIDSNHEVNKTEQMMSDELPEPIQNITKTNKTESRESTDDSIVNEKNAEVSILEPEGATDNKESGEPVKNRVIIQRPKRRRQKLVLQQS